jgi:hypothetical protein
MLELCPSNEIRALRPSSDSASLAASTRASSADVPRSTSAKGATASTCSSEICARRRKQARGRALPHRGRKRAPALAVIAPRISTPTFTPLPRHPLLLTVLHSVVELRVGTGGRLTCNTGEEGDRGILDFLTGRTHISGYLTVKIGWRPDGMA